MAKLEPAINELCEECLLVDTNRKRAAKKTIVLAGKKRIPLCRDHVEELCSGCAADSLLGEG